MNDGGGGGGGAGDDAFGSRGLKCLSLKDY
jgi:hypothetical protein